MKTNEFKAWFDGFTEAMDKAPTQKQWARIKERVAEIDGTPVTYPIYVDRYSPYHYPVWAYVSNTMGGSSVTSSVGSASCNVASLPFDSCNAMYALGTADAQNLARTA